MIQMIKVEHGKVPFFLIPVKAHEGFTWNIEKHTPIGKLSKLKDNQKQMFVENNFHYTENEYTAKDIHASFVSLLWLNGIDLSKDYIVLISD